MTSSSHVPAAVVRRVADLLRGIRVVHGRGLIDPRRPAEMLAVYRVVSKAGPFVGALVHGARADRSAPALVDSRGTLTFDDLDKQSTALARGLAGLGLRPGEVVAAVCRDHRGLVLAALAAGKVGVRMVFMNTGFAAPQFLDVAARERVAAVIYDREFTSLVDGLSPGVIRVCAWTDVPVDAIDTIEHLIATNSVAPLLLPGQPGGVVLLTSGTTGTPKGAPREKVSPLQAAQLLDRLPLTRGGTVVTVAPIFHGTGLALFTLGLSLGKKVVLSRKFDAEATLVALAEHRADTLIVVPTMLQRIVDLGPEVLARYDTSALRIIFSAGSALSPDLVRRTQAAFGDVLYNLYGSTEVAAAAIATPTELRRAPATAGRAPVGCRIALYDEKRRRITEPGATGTIFVSSGLSFRGYTDGRTKEIVDGMLCTGDLGHFDADGLLFVDGREDDMIVSGGENVFPLEVENLLAERADVVEAAVIGVDDPHYGKRLRAFVVTTPGADRDERVIQDYVKANLARFKVPREVFFIDAIPRNPTGKVLRGELERHGG